MKRFVVLAVAFAIMFGLRGITSQSDASLTLAAVGFVVLAAFTVGELGARLGLPKVTGYIVAGVVLGPQVSNILSTGVVAEMRVFNTLALGLIATSAGLELDLKAIGRVWKALTAMVLLKIPLLIGLVGGTFVTMETFFPSLGVPTEAIFPMALIIAVLGIGTSPSIALAVVNEGRSKGRLTDLLLAIAVVKDLVVVVSLAVALALAKAMLDPTAHLDAHVLVHVAEELGSSMLVGALLGGLLIAYIRYIRKQMLLMTVLMILVVAELSATLHLELLLVFIMAGFLVRNVSPYEHDLLEPIERIALPVFVVFFATAGAGVDLIGTWAVFPLTISLVVVRVVAFYIAGRVGGYLGGEGPVVIQNAWLTWLPQAGVTLGLVFLAEKALPELGPQILSIGLALVAVNLLVGPVTLGFGLTRAGEMGAGLATPHGAHDHPDAAPSVEPESEALPAAPTEEQAIEADRSYADVLDRAPAESRPLLEGLGRQLESEMATLLDDARPDVLGMKARSVAMAERGDSIQARLERAMVVAPADDGTWSEDDGKWLALLEDHWTRWMSLLQALPEFVVLQGITAPEHHVEREATSSWFSRRRAAIGRARMWRDRRQIPLRMMARVALEHRLTEALRDVSASRSRHLAKVAEKHSLAILEGMPCSAVPANTENWVRCAEISFRHAVADGMQELTLALQEYVSPLGRPALPRYSEVEADVRLTRESLEDDAPVWDRAVAATTDQLRLTAVVAALSDFMNGLEASWGTAALAEIEDVIVEAVDAAISDVEAVLEDARSGVENVDWNARMKAVFPLKARIAVRMAAQAYRQRVQPDKLTNELAGLIDRIPEVLVRTGTVVSSLTDPRELLAESIRARQHFRSVLMDQRVPELSRTMDALVPQLESAHVHIAEGVEVAAYGVTAALRESDDRPEGAIGALERSIGWLRDYRASVIESIADCRKALEEEGEEIQTDLWAALGPRSGVSRVQSNVAAMTSRLRSRTRTAGRIAARGVGLTASWLESHVDHPVIRERAIRSGLSLFDPQEMRHFLLPMRAKGLPKAAEAMFSLRAVDDRRQFIARRPSFERLNHLLNDPDPEAPLFALLSGARGSGRTSLVNMLQLAARKRHVVRPADAYHDRNTGILAALAGELRCDPSAIEATLAANRTLVILDNIERFVLPTREGLADLEAVLALAGRTSVSGTQWVMTIEDEALLRLDEWMSVGSLFNQHLRLGPIGWQELESVLRGRARLGGFEVDATLPAGRLKRVQWAPEDLWFRRLAQTTEGNLGGAIAAWRSELFVEDRKLVARSLSNRRIPFFGQLSVPARGVVSALHTWGSMTLPELAVLTGIEPRVLAGHVQTLCATSLVERSGSSFQVDFALLQSVRHEIDRSYRHDGDEP